MPEQFESLQEVHYVRLRERYPSVQAFMSYPFQNYNEQVYDDRASRHRVRLISTIPNRASLDNRVLDDPEFIRAGEIVFEELKTSEAIDTFEVAAKYGLNVNTVRRVIHELERRGWVSPTTRETSGVPGCIPELEG